MKHFWKSVFWDSHIFGGFDMKERLFFLLPSIRISYIPYGPACFAIHIGVGFLFWEFVFTIEWEKFKIS